MSTKKERMYQRIKEHGENLIALMGVKDFDPIKLCKSLRQLEIKGNLLATRFCNGEIGQDEFDYAKISIKTKAQAILGSKIPVIFNGDPRGYALKIDDKFCRDKRIYKDWGGYGILAPDFST